VDLSSCLPAARSVGTTVLVCGVQECRIYQYWLQNHDSENHRSASPALGQWSSLLKERTVEEDRKARATGTRSRAFPISPGNSPSRIASCHQRHRNHSFGDSLKIDSFHTDSRVEPGSLLADLPIHLRSS